MLVPYIDPLYNNIREEESFRRIDYRPASTLLIRGEEMMSRLTKFLIEYDKTKATTGQLANIPPTIISLSPFLHANIEKLQVRLTHNLPTMHLMGGSIITYFCSSRVCAEYTQPFIYC